MADITRAEAQDGDLVFYLEANAWNFDDGEREHVTYLDCMVAVV